MNTDANIYAYHGSIAFNQWMDDLLHDFTRDVETIMGDNLTALILGGGYGRGEGGIEIIDGQELPYNDLDFTIVVDNIGAVPHKEMDRISAVYAAKIKIHVDFSRPLTVSAIRNWPPWLMWYDLLNGHIILSGPQDILTANAPECVKAPLPPIEALRLLLNRGAGLLWAMRVVREAEPEPDRGFVIRNYYKLLLALGDAVLISRKRFATPYRGRDLLLEELAAEDASVHRLNLQDHYREALKFKFSPHEYGDTIIDADILKEAVNLWTTILLDTEMLRTGRQWTRPREYAEDPFVREKSMNTLAERPKNILRNMRFKRLSWLHPREWLYREIPHLLINTDPDQGWTGRSATAMAVWNQYN